MHLVLQGHRCASLFVKEVTHKGVFVAKGYDSVALTAGKHENGESMCLCAARHIKG